MTGSVKRCARIIIFHRPSRQRSAVCMAAEQTARWPRLQLPSSADAVTIWCVSYLLVGSCELVQTFDICELEKATRGPRVTQTDEHFQLLATTLKRKSSLRICSISLALMSWTRGRWSK